MMTSVTLPSSSSPIHGGYSAIGDEPSAGDSDFESSRPNKRSLTAPITESCKKRRKQSTPVRISAADSDSNPTEGKLTVPSPETETRCPVCQLLCKDMENLDGHLKTEHANVECKKEPEDVPADSPDAPVELTNPRHDVPWMADLQSKEWMNPSILPFSSTNHMFMTLSQFPQPETLPARQTIRIFNPDAYCELCNKEFCNKYFLKTHKANKHGIYSDPPTSDPSATTVNIPSYATNNKPPTSSVEVSPIKAEIKSHGSVVVNPFSDLFASPFSSKLFPKISKLVAGNLEHEPTEIGLSSSNGLSNGEAERNMNDENVTESSCSPRTIIQYDSISLKGEAVDHDVASYYNSSDKMSPGHHQSREHDLSNRLRRIGVMNPKAFCEICCKEYCNKYFLRTHKMKRHGIFIPDDGKERDLIKDSFGNVNWSSHNTQTSPLNLIMGEQSNTSSLQLYNDRKTSSPSDISCELCGIKFQNTSLAQLHNVSVHSKLQFGVQEASSSNSEEDKTTETPTDKAVITNDTISEDLQKLQTMILQLNDLDVSKANCTCNACNKEFENRYFLHAHMMTEHGLLLDDVGDNEKSCETDPSINNNTMCDLCGKDFQNIQDMKKHTSEYHASNQTNPETKDEFNGFTTPEKGPGRSTTTTGQIAERRASMSLTPTSSYCEICNKELCNKYFMKTHMQRMHGIEIENGAQIGGVICDICNKELCSKYFLRVHKHNTHGIVEYGASLLQPRKGEEPTSHPPAETDTALKPTDLADLSHRYFTHFTEVCTICSRRFRSTKWLKAHLLSDHGQAGVDKWTELEQQLQHPTNQQTSKPAKNNSLSERISPTLKIPNGGQEQHQSQPRIGIPNVLSSIFGADETNAKTYHCSYCPFTTPVLPFLFVHERSHSLPANEVGENVSLKCPVCAQTFPQADLLQHHVFSQHPFLPLPPFFNGSVEPQNETATPKEQLETAEEIEEVGSSGDNLYLQSTKIKKMRRRMNQQVEISPEVAQAVKDVSKRSHLPATYAIAQNEDLTQTANAPAYIMQAFLMEESGSERKIVPSLVFLPVLQKQSAPLSVTFTLTPA